MFGGSAFCEVEPPNVFAFAGGCLSLFIKERTRKNLWILILSLMISGGNFVFALIPN